MAIVIALILGVLALGFVLYPLYRRSPDVAGGARGPEASGEGENIVSEREQAARSALQEVELDYQLGNIAEPDYQALRERYMRRALVVLKSRYERERELDKEIEEQLRKMKEEEDDKEIEEQLRKMREEENDAAQ
jgi:hypothetical protein